jgi:glycosyltransferase involved in cell wall biosynthesis
MSRPLRVALGPMDVAGIVTRLAPQLEALGADVEVLLSYAPFGFPAARVAGRGARAAYGARAAVRRDVLHFHFGVSWLPWNLDARWARIWRRTLVVSYYGDDCRIAEVAKARFPARGRVTDPRRDPGVRRRLARLGRICHAATAADMELATYLSPYFKRVYLVPLPVPDDPPREQARRKSSTPPVVVHVSSAPALKGTATIRSAVEAVARRVPLEFRVLERIPHERVVEELAEADIVVDQLNSATTGLLALEAMQFGLPVLCELDPRARAPFQLDSPVVAVAPETLETELEKLVRDSARRVELGDRGREFVSRVHAAPRVAAALLRVYGHAPRAAPGLYEAAPEAVRPLEWSPETA